MCEHSSVQAVLRYDCVVVLCWNQYVWMKFVCSLRHCCVYIPYVWFQPLSARHGFQIETFVWYVIIYTCKFIKITLNSLKEITLYIAFLLCNISIVKLSQEHRFLCQCIIDKTCEVICFIENISWYISPNNTLISFLSAYAMFVRWQTCFGLKMLDMLSGYCLKCCVL